MESVSAELLFEDVQRQLIALHEVLQPGEVAQAAAADRDGSSICGSGCASCCSRCGRSAGKRLPPKKRIASRTPGIRNENISPPIASSGSFAWRKINKERQHRK